MRLKTPKSSIEINLDKLPGNAWVISKVTRAVVALLNAPGRYAPKGCHVYSMPDGRELVIAVGRGETLEQSVRPPKHAARAIPLVPGSKQDQSSTAGG